MSDQAPSFTDNHADLESVDAWVTACIGAAKGGTRLATKEEMAVRSNQLPFNREAAMRYAIAGCPIYCPCGDYYGKDGGDCAHFISHYLDAGGVRIEGWISRKCSWGLNTWAPDLLVALQDAASEYSNVRRMVPSQAGRGDVGLLMSTDNIPVHAFILADRLIDASHAVLYQHGATPCGKVAQHPGFIRAAYYRIG